MTRTRGHNILLRHAVREIIYELSYGHYSIAFWRSLSQRPLQLQYGHVSDMSVLVYS
jgi:hypothetical protein